MNVYVYFGWLCACLVVSASEMEYFLRSDGELLTPNTFEKSVFNETYLLPAVYSGFTNQRLSFYVSALYSVLYNVTLVLPEWVFDYNYIHEAQLRPFSYFYSINTEKLAALEDINKLRYVESLPSHLWSSCFAQLQTMSTELNYQPHLELLQQYSSNHGVICLHADGTFYGLSNVVQNFTGIFHFVNYPMLPIMQSIRSIVDVSPMYSEITQFILSRMKERYGHADFLSVHVRTEPDFVHACKYWDKRHWQDEEPNMLRACLQDDSVIYSYLTSPRINIPLNNSILLIMNYDSEDFNFSNMSILCNHRCDGPEVEKNCNVFHCIRKEMLVSPVELLQRFPDLVNTPSSLAMIDDQLAQHGILFFGNLYSSLSVEIYYERKLGMTPYTESVFYNRYCSSYSQDINDCP